MKRGKDNSFSEKGGPPGYVPLTLHQLGIGLTYYDEQRPAPQRSSRNEPRRNQDGNGRYGHVDPGNEALPVNPNDIGDGSELGDVGPDDGMTQEAALDQLQSNRNNYHANGGGGGGRRHHGGSNGGGGGNGRRQRHSNGGGNGGGRRGGGGGGGGNHNGPMRGGIAQGGGGRHRRGGDDDSHQATASTDAPRSAAISGAEMTGGGESEE